MTEQILVPFGTYQLRTDAAGFDALADLHRALSAYRNAEIVLDCERLFWVDAHLAAALMTVMHHAQINGNTVKFRKMPDNVKMILRKNGFLAKAEVDRYNTTIPLDFFDLDQHEEFSDYTKKHLRRKEMPKMTEALTRKIFEGIDELFANCSLHSLSPTDVVATGQFFPRRDLLSFAIADGGRGIDGSLKAAGIPVRSAASAIDWAMQSNNTSRQGDMPGGLGLKVLRDFVELNKGSLVVVSSGGIWRQSGSRVTKQQLSNPFPGTVAVIEIKTNDRHVYDLKKVDPGGIW